MHEKYFQITLIKNCTVKPVLSGHSKRRPNIGFQYQLSLNAGQKYCRMLHSAILLTFIKLPFVIKIFVLSFFEWPLKTGFTVVYVPVASLTTAISVGLPSPDLNRTAETIFLYRLSSSSRVLALLSVISRNTGCKRDSSTLLCSSRKSAEDKMRIKCLLYPSQHVKAGHHWPTS